MGLMTLKNLVHFALSVEVYNGSLPHANPPWISTNKAIPQFCGPLWPTTMALFGLPPSRL